MSIDLVVRTAIDQWYDRLDVKVTVKTNKIKLQEIRLRIPDARQGEVYFFNPTDNPIQVDSLGLTKDSDRIDTSSILAVMKSGKGIISFIQTPITHVMPGEIVAIPEGLTRSSKRRSAVACIAPQLVRMDYQGMQSEITGNFWLVPLSWEEWNKHEAIQKVTQCCKRLVIWSDDSGGCLCSGCFHRINE